MTPKNYKCILSYSDEPDIGLTYNSAVMKILAYYTDEVRRKFLMVSPNNRYVVQCDDFDGHEFVQKSSAFIAGHGVASEYYGQWVQVVPPMESGLFTELQEA